MIAPVLLGRAAMAIYRLFQNSLARETRQQSTVVTHSFEHTKAIPENVGVELLRRIWPYTA